VAISPAHANLSVVIALAGKAGWTPPSGGLTAICNQVLIECYSITQDATGTVTAATGIDFLHGYATSGTGTAAAPIVRDTTLYNQSCTDDSGPYFLLRAACTVGVKAKIDFGTAAGVDPSLAPTLAQVKVAGWGCPNSGPNPKGCKMVYNTAGANAGFWTTDGSNGYPLMPQDGLGHPIDLNWGTGTGGSSQSGTLTSVQRSFSADADTSGPVQYIRADDTAPFANSLSFGAHSLSVTIGVKESLQANQTSPTAPAVALKVVGGSSTQAIDCDPSKSNLRDELATGCSPQYTINRGTACNAASFYRFPQSAPWDCTLTQTGGAVGQVYDGMLCRTQGVCYSGSITCKNPIHWVDSNGDGKVTIPQDISLSDPRIMAVFVTPFGAFSGSGNNVVPITNFASFYVTGFSKNGGGQGDPCMAGPGVSAPDPVPTKTGGWIVGHFIKYVDTIGGGGTGDPCDFSSFGSCVAVLTK
jgi:hypothetical protein